MADDFTIDEMVDFLNDLDLREGIDFRLVKKSDTRQVEFVLGRDAMQTILNASERMWERQ